MNIHGKRIINLCFGLLMGMVLPAAHVSLADDNLIEINRVAAKVNNEIVTWGEIDRAMTSLNFTNSEKRTGSRVC